MKAIRIDENGGPEVLRLHDVPEPQPGEGEALVRLHNAGLNFIDIYQRRGLYPKELPFVLGLEGAGTVEKLGAGVQGLRVGDRVAYTSQPGAYAQYSVVKADSLIRLPDRLSFEQGAAFPLQGMTAHYLIHEYRKPTPDDTVLVHAAAGGMGLLLVQWAKHLGARVIGTTSSDEKAAIAKEAGADEVIVYTREDWVEAVRRLTGGAGVEIIIDGVGKTTFPGDLKAAALRGTIVVFGSASGRAEPFSPNDLQTRSLTVSGGSLFNWLLTREELERRAADVIAGITEGWLKLRIDRVYPLAQAAEAHRLLESRQSVGKILLNCSV